MMLSGIPTFTISMTVVLCIFIVTYVLLLIFSDYRAYIAAGAAVIFVILGLCKVIPMTPLDALVSIEWNVILMILGTMEVVGLFIESKMPALLAEKNHREIARRPASYCRIDCFCRLYLSLHR